jgi:uncharacterized protein DUF11
MLKPTRFGPLALVVGLGTIAAILLLSTLSVVTAAYDIDLIIEAKAPTYTDVDSTYIVNVSYANKGHAPASDTWITITLPPGVEFAGATYSEGTPFPPDVQEGNVLTWTVPPLPADSTWGHIMLNLDVAPSVPDGKTLEVVAGIATSAEEPDTSNNLAVATTTVSYMAGSQKQVRAGHALPGDVLDYTISIQLSQKYSGGTNGRWVTMTDTLPYSDQTRFLGWTGSITGVVLDGHTLHWAGQVYAGEALTLAYRLGLESTITPNLVLSNVAVLGWTGHQIRLGPVTATVVAMPDGAIALGPDEGGQLTHTCGVTVEIPPPAVTDTIQLRLGPVYTDMRPADPPGGLFFAHRAIALTAHRFGTPVGAFNCPLTITMNYAEADLDGLRRETLRVWTREGPDGPWGLLGAPTYGLSGTLRFTTTHLSEFALFAEPKYATSLPLIFR